MDYTDINGCPIDLAKKAGEHISANKDIRLQKKLYDKEKLSDADKKSDEEKNIIIKKKRLKNKQ